MIESASPSDTHTQQSPLLASSVPAPAKPSIAALTGLRFFAALNVVLYHFARVPLPGWAFPIRNIIDSGYVGVSLFFLLSGFIMSYSYLTPQAELRGTRRNFYVSRFARVYPAYLLAFLLAAPTDILLSLRANQLTTAAAKLAVNAFVVLTFLQAWTPFTAWAWNFPAWSVSVEAFFYLLFPWIGPRLFRVRASRCLVAAAALWLVSLLAPAALFLLRGPTGPPQVGDYLQMAVEFTPLLRLPEFAIGILVGRAFVAGRFDRLRGPLLSSVCALTILAVMAFSPVVPHPFLAGGLLTPLFALLLVTLAQGGGPLAWLLSLPFMILLGEASYGIYILQIPVSFVLGVPPPHTTARVLLSYCFALILVALLSFRFVEAPLRGRIRKWFSGPEQPQRPQNPELPALPQAQSPPSSRARPVASGHSITRRTAILTGASTVAATAIYAATHSRRTKPGADPISPGDATWVSTTETSPWEVVALHPRTPQWNTREIAIHLDRPAQTIQGFGCCFNELGWTSLQALKPSDQESIFQELFAPQFGASFNLCRMPIGANDFSRQWYSYDEVPGDFALEHFSIANDLQTIVPFIKSAQRHNPSLRLWASPWSPPTWMKRNGHYAEATQIAGRPPNGIRPDQVGEEGSDMFLPDDRYYTAYANYFGRFIDAYKQQGIDIGMVMPQNEFNSAQPFPSCTWTPASLARLIRHLGPVLSKRDVAIFFGTLERGNADLLEAALEDPETRSYVRGVGVQWAGKGALSTIRAKHPDLQIYQSEQECGDGTNSWRYCVYCWDLLKLYLEHGANAYMYWNLALPEGGESHWGWPQNSLLTVDASTRTYRFHHEYFLLKHVSHFVQPGARRVATEASMTDVLAFHNPDGSVVVVLFNALNFESPVNIVVEGRSVSGSMKARSFNTLLLHPRSLG